MPKKVHPFVSDPDKRSKKCDPNLASLETSSRQRRRLLQLYADVVLETLFSTAPCTSLSLMTALERVDRTQLLRAARTRFVLEQSRAPFARSQLQEFPRTYFALEDTLVEVNTLAAPAQCRKRKINGIRSSKNLNDTTDASAGGEDGAD